MSESGGQLLYSAELGIENSRIHLNIQSRPASIMVFYKEQYFFWLQFVYLVWLIVRPAPVFRLPWCLICHCLRRCCRYPPEDLSACIFLIPGLRHTLPPSQYLLKSRSYVNFKENNVCHYIESDTYVIRALGRCVVVVGKEDFDHVSCLFCCEMDKQHFVYEYLKVNVVINVIRLCDLDKALKFYFRTKCFSIRVKSSLNFIERSPLGRSRRHWMSSIIATLPLVLQGRDLKQASAILTIAIYVLDIFSNYLSEFFANLWKWSVRLLKRLANPLPMNVKLILFFIMPIFDQNLMPSGVVDLKMKRTEITEFLFLPNCVLKDESFSVEEYNISVPDVIDSDAVSTMIDMGSYRMECNFRDYRDGVLSVHVIVRDVVFDKLRNLYNCPRRCYFVFRGFFSWLSQNRSACGLVVGMEKGSIDTVVCLGITETINSFWSPDLKLFKGKFGTSKFFWVGDIGDHGDVATG